MAPDIWRTRVKNHLKAELKRRKMTYFDLANKLATIGVEEDEKNIAKKVSRGSFKAIFLFQCLEVIGCELPLSPLQGEDHAPAALRNRCGLQSQTRDVSPNVDGKFL